MERSHPLYVRSPDGCDRLVDILGLGGSGVRNPAVAGETDLERQRVDPSSAMRTRRDPKTISKNLAIFTVKPLGIAANLQKPAYRFRRVGAHGVS